MYAAKKKVLFFRLSYLFSLPYIDMLSRNIKASMRVVKIKIQQNTRQHFRVFRMKRKKNYSTTTTTTTTTPKKT